MHNLKSFNLDFLDSESAGCKLGNYIVFGKLPNVIRHKLIDKTGTNYPSLAEIFKHTKEIVLTLNATSNSNFNFKKDGSGSHFKPKQVDAGGRQDRPESSSMLFKKVSDTAKFKDIISFAFGGEV